MTRRRLLRIVLPVTTAAIALAGLFQTASASDWPAYRRDARRSAVSTDQLEFPLDPVWELKARRPPAPAFADPLRHPTDVDFAQVRDFSQPVQLNFDHASHPVAAGGRVFFGSSADDTVRCVSLATGQQEWVFVTGGPVRFAPHVVGDRVYVASDDGFVYCLTASDGNVIWQFRAAPSARQLVGNGRMISRWPLRSGVLVVDGILYVTAGMWPSEGVFVYALDAETGQVKWVNDTSGTVNLPTANLGAYSIGGVAPTGYLLAGDEALVVPTGRSMPASYSLADGTLLKSFAPSYQNKRGGPVRCIDPHGSVIFGYPRERLTGTDYSIHYIYQLPQLQQYGTMRADRVLADKRTYLVVNDLIRCATFNPRYTSSRLVVHWQVECPSKSVHCLALAGNSLLLGVDNRVVARDRETGGILWERDDLDGLVLSLAIVDGQLIAATDVGSIYCFGSGQRAGETVAVSPPQERNVIEPVDSQLRHALQDASIDSGLALVIGQRDQHLAEQLAAASRLQVVLLLEDADAVAKARYDLLQPTNLDRGQVSVQQYVEQEPLPFADYAFNVVVTTGEAAASRASELHRVLRPVGGMLYIDHATAENTARVQTAFRNSNGDSAVDIRRVGDAAVVRRGKLPGALDWDSGTDRDQRVKWPLELLWFGGPGSKRTGSGSRPPVAAGGRNLVIGKNHLVALDAYNGTELWSRTLPYLYRNIGRLRNAPGPIRPWLTNSVSADDDHVWLNFGNVVYRLDAATGDQQAVHGELPEAETFRLKDEPQFLLDHYQKPDDRGTSAIRTKVSTPAGSIQLAETSDAKTLKVILQLDANVEVSDMLYWELFFDVRSPDRRANLYEQGIFHLLVRPAAGRVETGVGVDHPNVSVSVEDDGRRTVLTISLDELAGLGGTSLESFSFAAALNHKASPDQKAMAVGRGYLRWEFHADAFATSFNNGWSVILRSKEAAAPSAVLLLITELPEHALKSGRIGGVGRKAGYVVNVKRERENPLSLDVSAFEYNRGKGCGNPVASGSLHVLRSGTLAFYDLDDDSGMRYFGGVRPGCTISAVPAQGLVFAAEASSGCNCNYNFKTTLALAPARQRRHEDWAMFASPLTPAALLHTGRFNLAAPGDRKDDQGGLWLQYPRAPTYSNRTMPVPVQLSGETLKHYRVNADRVAISGTDRPWLYSSGIEGVEKVRLQLFMSDKEGVVVFPGEPPVLDAVLEDKAWERRYGVAAGTGSSMFLSHDKKAIYVGYEIVPPLDRRGKRLPWTTKATLPYSTRFSADERADDAAVWEADSLEFLVSDTSLKTILHFGIGVTGGRYDGLWSAAKKTEVADFAPRWAGAADVTVDKATAEFALPWDTLRDAGLDLENLVIRPRSKKPLTRQPHITHGFRPMLVQSDQPSTKQYRVVLHFAELNDVAVGERVFDIELQGRVVIKDFDPVAAGGGRHRAVVRTFSGIQADRAMELRLVSGATPDADDETLPPILSALELLLDK
jgi:outer membrane protein assembly factor BamB